MERTTIIRWTGRGKVSRLKSSVEFSLKQAGVRGRVEVIGGSIVVAGPEPLALASLLGGKSGVAWTAAGLTAASRKELASASAILARRYLKRGDGFSVEAEGGGGATSADVSGMIVSAVLETVKGSRVSSEAPKVKFRAASDGAGEVVGVEVRPGPGGVPTGDSWATCMVSGGIHSAVVASDAILAGYRLRLVHASVGEESILAVARLYVELCRRCDPRGLKLEVIEGDSVQRALAAVAVGAEGEVFGGFHFPGSVPRSLPKASAPLFLLPEERFGSEFDALGVRGFESEADWAERGTRRLRVKRFQGPAADVSAVLDGLR